MAAFLPFLIVTDFFAGFTVARICLRKVFIWVSFRSWYSPFGARMVKFPFVSTFAVFVTSICLPSLISTRVSFLPASRFFASVSTVYKVFPLSSLTVCFIVTFFVPAAWIICSAASALSVVFALPFFPAAATASISAFASVASPAASFFTTIFIVVFVAASLISIVVVTDTTVPSAFLIVVVSDFTSFPWSFFTVSVLVSTLVPSGFTSVFVSSVLLSGFPTVPPPAEEPPPDTVPPPAEEPPPDTEPPPDEEPPDVSSSTAIA